VRQAVALAACAAALAGCGGSTETVTVTTTERETVTETVASPALPAPVERTRTAIAEAAASGDYEVLRPLIPEPFSYTFGGPFQGGAIGFWRFLEREHGQRPIAILADLLELPYTLYRGVYTWPFAFDKAPDELTGYERGLLRSVGGENLSDDFGEGTGYLGWRVGIEPDGDWVFFIAGD
jgi:hypothetical protein